MSDRRDEFPPPGSMLAQWERLSAALTTMREEIVYSVRERDWRPWAIATGLAWLGLVVVTVVR